MEDRLKDKIVPVDDQIQSFINGEAHSASCLKYTEEDFVLPPWFDAKKYKKGQKYMQDNIFSQFTCTLSGLMCVLSIPSILEILVKTQKSSTTLTAYRRYVSTIFHAWSWYMQDLIPGTDAWNSLIAVRNRHFRSSTVSKSKGFGQISQRDMAYTQFGFFGIGFLLYDKIGMVKATDEEREGYIHFWRTIGYMIGIEDRYNICRPSVEETKEVCEFIHKEVYCHHMKHPPKHFFFMTQALLKAMWFYSPMLAAGPYIYFTFWLIGLKEYPFKFEMNRFEIKLFEDPDESRKLNNSTDDSNVIAINELGWYSRFQLRLLMIMHMNWLPSKFGRWYLNSQTHLTIMLLKYFPFLSIIYFGIKNAFVNMFVEDITVYAKPMTNTEVFAVTQY